MILEIYGRGKYEHGIGAAAYAVVTEGQIFAYGAKRLGREFILDGQTFPCNEFNMEILAAICGMARCAGIELVNVYSDRVDVISWLSGNGTGGNDAPLSESWMKRTAGKNVLVDSVPCLREDNGGNRWLGLCEHLAKEALAHD